MLRSPLLALAALLVVLPAAAQGQANPPAQIKGDVLTISTDENGRVGAAYTGSQVAEFFGSRPDTETGVLTTGNAGSDVTVLLTQNQSTFTRVFGPHGTVGTLVSGPTSSGSGSAADPFTLRTTWSANDDTGAPLLNMTQTLTYVNGRNTFNSHLDVTNTSGAGLSFRASTSADLYGGGSDSGTGVFEAGPPRFVGGFNVNSGAITGLQESTPWSHYEEGQHSSVIQRAIGDPRDGVNLADTTNPQEVDNDVGAQWDNNVSTPLPPGGTSGFDIVWRFDRTFDLQPGSAFATPGVPVPFTATVTNSGGTPRAGVKIVYTDNSTPIGTVTTGKDGTAPFDFVPLQSGTDTVSAFADFNGNGTLDTGEPHRDSLVATGGQVTSPPIQGQTATAAPLVGTVKVKFPKGFTATGKQSAFAHSAANKFTTLKTPQSIPIGSQIDVSNGSIQLASSTSGVATPATIQTGAFSQCQPSKGKKKCKAPSADQSMFQMTQQASGNGIVEMVMLGTLSCPSGKGKAVTAARKKKSRSLWSSDNGGRFRTRGRNSSATVRGTEWLTKDTCSGTETRVTRGSVVVKDFTKKKNIVVKQGKRYIARPKKK